MNYLLKYGLTMNPFIKNNSKDILVEMSSYKQLLFRLHHLEETKGIGLITGQPGLGKTTSLRFWVKSLNSNMYKVVYLAHSTITVHEFYRALCDAFELEVKFSKRQNLVALQKRFKQLYIEKRITPVIILDEANYLNHAILNDLKILFNFDMDSKEPYILILAGQSVLRSTLNLISNEPLKQRISMNYNFEPLDKDEAKSYIDIKLQKAGANTDILTSEAYNIIINTSGGIPRVINNLMDKVLLLLENKKANLINEELAMEACDENNI